MPKLLKWLISVAPFSITLLLIWTAIGSIKLHTSLKNVGIKGYAPEDIYGFGFAGVWISLLLPFTCLCLLSRFLAGQKRQTYWATLLASFTACSVAGFWLDHIVWAQIIR